MKVVIFGATGGIGSKLVNLYRKQNEVVAFSSGDLDFTSVEFKKNFPKNESLLKIIDNADLIINASGVLGGLTDDYESVFDVNFNSNWLIIRHFIEKPPIKEKKFIMIGSSSYKKSRDDVMLYAASKAALFSLFGSAKKYFSGSRVIIGLVNPPMVKTNLSAIFEGKKMSAGRCAKLIHKFEKSLNWSESIDI